MNPAENPIENPDARRYIQYLPPRLEGCSGNRHVGYENGHGINILRVTGTGINLFHYLAKGPITSTPLLGFVLLHPGGGSFPIETARKATNASGCPGLAPTKFLPGRNPGCNKTNPSRGVGIPYGVRCLLPPRPLKIVNLESSGKPPAWATSRRLSSSQAFGQGQRIRG